METIVGVVRGTDKRQALAELLTLTQFDSIITAAHAESGKSKTEFRVVIKPNMMVFVNQTDWPAIITDRELVEELIDHLSAMGFVNLAICESRTDVSTMLKNQTVAFIAEQLGYAPKGRYRIADLTLEMLPFTYEYTDPAGRLRHWRDVVGRTWQEADFRITFAKAKTHEHDWLTLGTKNVYGCFPAPDKIRRYHMREEVPDVTARSLRSFPVHFSLVDAWVASDGFQGYKIAHPQPLQMLFGGADLLAVDIEIFKRAGFDPCPSLVVRRALEQTRGGTTPRYTVAGDTSTTFAQLTSWENIDDATVAKIDRREEVYVNWGLLNLRPAARYVDYAMFPPKNILYRLGVWALKLLYRILAPLGILDRLFRGGG